MELLRDQRIKPRPRTQRVLILVVMELLRDPRAFLLYVSSNCLNPCCNGITERLKQKYENKRYLFVLILVVMELLRDLAIITPIGVFECLNPCCNGITERHEKEDTTQVSNLCLNPCCNGITERPDFDWQWKNINNVLILVVMELLRDNLTEACQKMASCLNPCCNGITERHSNLKMKEEYLVLILVVMELLRDLTHLVRVPDC